MKNITKLLLSFLLVFALIGMCTGDPGDKNEPFEIWTEDDLITMVKDNNGLYYKLMKNITLEKNVPWDSSALMTKDVFYSHLDLGGKIISNIVLSNNSDTFLVGLGQSAAGEVSNGSLYYVHGFKDVGMNGATNITVIECDKPHCDEESCTCIFPECELDHFDNGECDKLHCEDHGTHEEECTRMHCDDEESCTCSEPVIIYKNTGGSSYGRATIINPEPIPAYEIEYVEKEVIVEKTVYKENYFWYFMFVLTAGIMSVLVFYYRRKYKDLGE